MNDSGSTRSLATVDQAAATPAGEADPDDPQGREFGRIERGVSWDRYRILERVGEGGMGEVLRAYDPKLQREVALKRVRSDRLGSEARALLVREARMMAKLSHPNVVPVYDVVDAGLRSPGTGVVLVMEFVHGETLKQWMQNKTRPWTAIVPVFIEAGRGLRAGHEAGLLHRDFKPANVLVTDEGAVKVTDFGLAKATGIDSPSGNSSSGPASLRSGAVDDGLTEPGSVVGTPRYMAPEQHDARTLSTAADQYSFCVALWEALCGEAPFSGPAIAYAKSNGPRAWPNAATPRPIANAVVRGLSPHPGDRWPSMNALLQALAWNPSRRRNRSLAGLGGVCLISLAGVQWASWAQARATRCTGAADRLTGAWDEDRRAAVREAILGVDRGYATEVWTRTRGELDGYAQDWTAMHTDVCEATTVHRQQPVEVMDLRMACLDRAAVELAAVTAALADADAKVVSRAHELTALPPLSRCADVAALQQAVEPPLAQDAAATREISGLLVQAEVERKAGRYAEANEAVAAAKAVAADLHYRPIQTKVAIVEGLALESLGQYPAAEAALATGLKLASAQGQREQMRVAAGKLAYVVGYRRKRTAEGLAFAVLAWGLAQGDPLAEASIIHTRAGVLGAQGDYEESEAEHRWALELREAELGAEHLLVASSRNNLANILYAQGKYEEAEIEHRAALAVRESALGPTHPAVASPRSNLGNALYGQGRYAEAEAEHRIALAVRLEALGPEHPDVGISRNNLAAMLQVQGKYDEAEVLHRAALQQAEKTLGPEHPQIAGSRNNLAAVLQSQGKYAAAEVEFRGALAVYQTALGPAHPMVALSRYNLATVLQQQGKLADAEPQYRRALALYEAASPDSHHAADVRTDLALLLLSRDRPQQAVALAEQAWSRLKHDDVPPARQAEAAFILALALGEVAPASADRERAVALAKRALAAYAHAEGAHDKALGQVRAWLATQQGGRARTGVRQKPTSRR